MLLYRAPQNGLIGYFCNKNVTFVDTHSHIYLPEFDADRQLVVERAKNQGVATILLPNIDSRSIAPMLQTEKEFDNCLAMMGLHPTSVKDDYKKELDIVENHLSQRPFIGIGEIGIDLYWDVTHKQQQLDVFEQQLKWAIDLSLPVVIHCREAFPEVFQVVDKVHDGRLKGVFHSFGGGIDELQHIIGYKTFKVGINGIVTFKKSTLPEVLEKADPSLLLIETDAPYLAPHPHRGKRNEPMYVPLVAQRLAQVYGIPLEDMAIQLTDNSRGLFDIK